MSSSESKTLSVGRLRDGDVRNRTMFAIGGVVGVELLLLFLRLISPQILGSQEKVEQIQHG